MLKDLFDKGKCALGYHVEAWRYARDGLCAQTSRCPRCQAVSERVRHDWPDDWSQVSPLGCEFARGCRRCREQELRVDHQWDSPAYITDGFCEQAHPCSRCGASKEAAAVHIWSEWTYDTDGTCTQTLTCARCHAATASSRTFHDWSPWQHSPFYEARVQVCVRCAEMVFDFDPSDEAGVPMSMQRVAGMVAQVASAGDIAGLREGVLAHRRELLSPVADRYLRYAIEREDEPGTQESLAALKSLLTRCRSEGAEAVLRPQPVVPPPLPRSDSAPAAAAIDPRMVGHWRHTESMSSGGVSLVTDTHLVLEDGGRFAWWSKSAGSMGTTTSGRETGGWSVQGGTLRLAFDDGTIAKRRFSLTGDSLFCPDESRYRLWQRIDR